MQVLKNCNELLKKGCTGEKVVEELKKNYKTIHSLRTKTSQVRNIYDGSFDNEGNNVYEQMKLLAHTEDEKNKVEEIVKTYGRSWWINTKNEDLDFYVLRNKFKLLPKNVRDVNISKEDLKTVKKYQKEKIMEKHNKAPKIDGDKLLEHCESIIQNYKNVAMYELILALLLVSGRRTTELLNQKSNFIKKGEYIAEFYGQLKTKGKKIIYTIPLLVKFESFIIALNYLYSIQKTVGITNKCVSQKYQSGLRQYLLKHECYGMNNVYKVHLLRGIYSVIVFGMFECSPMTVLSITQRVLGHSNIDEALAYSALDVTFTRQKYTDSIIHIFDI